jgi:hypothetical protein
MGITGALRRCDFWLVAARAGNRIGCRACVTKVTFKARRRSLAFVDFRGGFDEAISISRGADGAQLTRMRT